MLWQNLPTENYFICKLSEFRKLASSSWISMSPFIYMRFETVPKELASSSWAERVAQEPIMLESYINSN
jgi:hypothetical protein